jgi:hypothetical protein
MQAAELHKDERGDDRGGRPPEFTSCSRSDRRFSCGPPRMLGQGITVSLRGRVAADFIAQNEAANA